MNDGGNENATASENRDDMVTQVEINLRSQVATDSMVSSVPGTVVLETPISCGSSKSPIRSPVSSAKATSSTNATSTKKTVGGNGRNNICEKGAVAS